MADDFWHGSNLDDQWDNGSRRERKDAFGVAMRFQNALDTAETEADDEPRAFVLHAQMRLKALLLAVGCDAVYGTDRLQRIASAPRQFGVHDFTSAAD